MAADLERETGLSVELEKSNNGAFEVFLDDRQIYSKWQQKRFPELSELLAVLK